MKKGILISAFATCGKSYLGKKYSNVIDLESSNYRYINDKSGEVSAEKRKGTVRKLNKEWPFNYYKAIQEALYKYDVILVQLKPEHLDYFDKNNIEYSIIYPSINNWDEVERRCIKRENNDNFIVKLKQVFISYYKNVINRKYKKLYILNDKMKRAEAVALTNFVVKRLKFLNPEPRFFGKRKWEEKLMKFESDFIDVLVNGRNNFYGAIWQFFESNDKIFLGEYGMRELAEHTKKKNNKWLYKHPNEEQEYLVYCE